jgi:iron(III) transport system ATP-binding protein
VADRIVVMNHGAIEQVGTPTQVYREPATPFVADFVGRINVLPARTLAGGDGADRPRASSAAGTTCHGGRDLEVYLRPEEHAGAADRAGDDNASRPRWRRSVPGRVSAWHAWPAPRWASTGCRWCCR